MTLEWVILFYIQSQIRLDYSEPSQSYGSYLNCKNIGIFSLFSKCKDSFIKCKNFFFWNEWQKCCDVMRNQISKTPTQVWLLLKVTDVKDYCTVFYDTKKWPLVIENRGNILSGTKDVISATKTVRVNLPTPILLHWNFFLEKLICNRYVFSGTKQM